MRILMILAAAASITACGAAQIPTGGVDMATAQKIEAKVRLPDGSRAMSTYARFYYIDQYTPAGMVSGWYVMADKPPFSTWPKPGIHLAKPNVSMADGGCYAIRLTYDPKKDEITDIRCNGFA